MLNDEENTEELITNLLASDIVTPIPDMYLIVLQNGKFGSAVGCSVLWRKQSVRILSYPTNHSYERKNVMGRITLPMY